MISTGEPAKMAHYRALSHDALLAELERLNNGSLSTAVLGGLFVVAAAVIGTDLLTTFYEVVWARLQGASPAVPPPSGGAA
jgi:hypothetical protein